MPDMKALRTKQTIGENRGYEIRQTNTTASDIFTEIADSKVFYFKDINRFFLDDDDYIPK